MAAQLSQSPIMKSYYQLVMSDNRIRSRLSVSSCTSDPDGSFIHGILDPLKTLQGQGSLGSSQCIVLIDGLDESERHRTDHGETIGSFVGKHLQTLPSWLKIVCTIRSDFVGSLKCLPFHQIRLVGHHCFNWIPQLVAPQLLFSPQEFSLSENLYQ